MSGRHIKPIALLSFIVLSLFSFSQEKQALENKRNQIQEQIQATNRLLSQNKSTTRNQLKEFELLSAKLTKMTELMNTIQLEASIIEQSIQQSKQKIKQQEQELESLRNAYAESVVAAYKQKKLLSPLVFVLTSKSFNKAIQRINYLKKINQHRQRQADTIEEVIAQLSVEQEKLVAQQKEKTKLLAEQTEQQQAYKSESAKMEDAINGLKDKQTELTGLLEKQKAEEQRLQAEIRAVIAREIAAQRAAEEAERKRLAAERAANQPKEDATTTETSKPVEAPKTKPAAPTFESAPALAKLSANFVNNKGNLPWPVQQGVITSALGEYSFSDIPGIKKDNDGIDIRTAENESARAIFNGMVRSVTTIPGFNRVIIIGHGDYFSVYGKLKSTSVSVGDEINAGQTIGIVDNKDGVSELHLQIWKGQSRLNPKDWLQSR